MKEKIKNAIQKYQCPGCMDGSDFKCVMPPINEGEWGVACGGHRVGTYAAGIGMILLGMPKGFNRLGSYDDMKIGIFETYEDGWQEPIGYSKWNIPTWKHLNEHGHTLIRGLSPRTNSPFLHVFLEDCMDKFDCREITADDIKEMD